MKKMGGKRFVLAVGFAVLCAGWVQADTIQPGHFTVGLNDVPGVDSGGWGAETLFTDIVNTVTSNRGFVPTICGDPSFGNSDSNPSECEDDPRMVVNNGGHSVPFPSSFNADENGGGLFDYQNDSGSPYTDILFTTTFVPGNTYTCASDIFSFCGFQVIHEMQGPDQLEILFIGGSIPIATPEPSEYLFLLLACAVVAVVYRLRSRRAD